MTFRMSARLLVAAFVLSASFFDATAARAQDSSGEYWAAEQARQAGKAAHGGATLFHREMAAATDGPKDRRLSDTVWRRGEGVRSPKSSNPSSATLRGAPSRTAGKFSLPAVAADLVAEARLYLGSANFTGFRGAWCKAALNIWLRATGHYADPSLLAIDALHDGRRLAGPRVGAIAVMPHHVAIVTSVARAGVWTISGNHGHRVGTGFYLRRSIVAFIEPKRM